MNILDLYRRESTISGFPVLIMGIVSGIAQSLLLGIITIAADTASHETLNFKFFVLFVIAFLIMMLGKRYALKKATVIAEEIIERVRVRLSNKIRNSELVLIENLGKGDIYTRVANDTNLISQTALVIINASQSAIMVIFCLFFIAVLSKLAFVITILSVIVGVINYLHHSNVVADDLRETTRQEGLFFEMINQILDGFKELKVNQRRSEDYFSRFKILATETKTLKVKTGIRFIVDLMYSEIFFYLLLAIVVFIMPRFEQIDSELIIRITAAVLFIMGPLNMVVGAIPMFARANMAVEQLYGLEAQLDAASQAYAVEEEAPLSTIAAFDEIVLHDLCFSYTDQYGSPLFTVGPLDFTLHKGEVVFLIGGNGSGKTTLLKLFTGLYYPDSGDIKVDGTLIDQRNYQAYRELFSIIFADFHLFDRLYGLDGVNEERVRDLLHLMELDKKTEIINGEFTNINLSTGQRKRLAMIVALLDNRPIYVFDEWAADQDPNFRQYFYEVLLRNLQDQGKTVVAVSHDDRYFHFADRVFKMEYGQFVNMKTV
ncbi:cyclic peptide export ABC transporter [candidate division KSB3 bacterium]|uniref:Cyclic peptide export ABC transporter n=1 Tax=candidate division KSB3 bacterium TaxID=2044937 RepID=A0A9D5JVR0_9BACT|nr:cyclic peptide export ABC transporter [candidate division KSB3 bacterium]MBD3324816.1 cyclic peptide export ABC transporter [candidate division KSB3 bacterium]